MTVRGESLRRVVFHADDYGMNAAVNQGILQAFRDGLLTSTSLLANAPAAKEACQAWQTVLEDLAAGRLHSSEERRKVDVPHLPFDLGIHLNLTQGRPVSGENYPAALLDAKGHFPGVGKLFSRLNRATAKELESVKSELQAQIEWMCEQGHQPTHLNGHQYIELIPPISAMIPDLLRRYAISAVRVAYERGLLRNVLLQGDLKGWGLALVKRHYAAAFRRRIRHLKICFPDRFLGTSHAGRIDRGLVIRFLNQSSDADFTEIGVHPAVASLSNDVSTSDPWFDPLARLRPIELEWLCGPELPNELTKRGLGLGRLAASES